MSTVRRFIGGGRGDGSSGTNAFVQPWGLSIAANGVTLFVADIGGHGIRRLEPGGLVVRIAGTYRSGTAGDGGLALQAQLQSPISAVGDVLGNVYLSEQGAGGRIRQIDVGTNIIHTIVPNAATGSSIFGPMQLALADGWLYCADSKNHRVVKYKVPCPVGSTAQTVLVAGNGTTGSGGDGGSATSAQLYTPQGVALRNGEVFIADPDSGTVRVVKTDGTIGTIIGGLKRPCAIAAAPNGDLYVAEYSGNRITRLTNGVPAWVLGACAGVTVGSCASQSVTAPVSSTDPSLQPITYPVGVAVSADGAVLYASSQQDQIVHAVTL